MNIFIRTTCTLFLVGTICYLVLAFYVKKEALVDNKKPSDLIMVLGARAYINKAYNPCLYSRMEHAVALYKTHYANKILVSGGTDKEDQINEAQTMRQIALELGVPSQDILLESASTSTYENFLFSKKIVDANQFRTVILVTEPFHSLRSRLVAQKIGFNTTSSPAKESSCWKNNTYFSKFFIKEPLAIMVYKIRNRI